ncbi:uncharacterized protein METZ01_LOCUS16646 [marine metagenome]|uniref:Uncharacterized protein n=1 Tax=marine metagenome TaxID=408172 RepID=A0A381P9Z3_9ZZZZ
MNLAKKIKTCHPGLDPGSRLLASFINYESVKSHKVGSFLPTVEMTYFGFQTFYGAIKNDHFKKS